MKYSFKILFVFVILISVYGCENKIEVIQNLGQIKEYPEISADTVEIIYSELGKIKLKVSAPKIDRYNLPEKQYIVFPHGIRVEQLDSAANTIAIITANYARYYEKIRLWIARNNVVAKNLVKNEELNTEELFWNQDKGIIYSKKFTKIVNADGVFFGEGGFEAKEDLSKWQMYGIKGKVNIKDEILEPSETTTY